MPLYALLSLPFAFVFAIPGLIGIPGISAGVAIVIPVLYGFGGFLMAVFGAWVYNVVATRIGGPEFVTSEVAH
ncbi:hypothetical protein [Massilia niastensis]|uniref:hypothetical protein n=1 Tax=Massilia niastensis TaxID=544911 RepID=UPI0003A07D3A|nr:hypothetical protein [Massilia niastensis]